MNTIKLIAKKIDRPLADADRLLETSPREKNAKKREKKLRTAERKARAAWEVCRRLPPEERPSPSYRAAAALTAILSRMGRAAEAEPMLFECCTSGQPENDAAGRDCMAYYGSLLCEAGDYNAAGDMLSRWMKAAESSESSQNTEAACAAYGSAACAFTYAEGVGYSGELFTAPVEKLLKMREKGVMTDSGYLIKGAYFAASEALYRTCWQPVSCGDAEAARQFAQCCRSECERAGERSFFLPASMRLLALAAARECQFADCVALCGETLDICSSYTVGQGESRFGSIQHIAADMNLLLGIMHYRAWHFEDSEGFFEAAIAALEADAQGRPLEQVGYPEVERTVMRVTAAEKMAFACRYLGLARYSLKEKYTLPDCVAPLRRAASLNETLSRQEPFFGLLAAEDYGMIRQMYEKSGDAEKAAEYDGLGKSCGIAALEAMNAEDGRSDGRLETLREHRRTALRLGLLELYGNYVGQELTLLTQPERQTDTETLAYLYFEMGDYCRTVGKYESAEECYAKVERHTFDGEGKPYYDTAEANYWEAAALGRVSCLVHMEKMPRAREIFRQYTERLLCDGAFEKSRWADIAAAARKVGLNAGACAEYFHTAAGTCGDDAMTAAELFNQEGICWYNASPEKDLPDGETPETADKAALTETFAARELAAFEKAFERLTQCAPALPKAVDLRPSLLSNIGECHVRAEKYDLALPCYNDAVAAFETLFASKEFHAMDQAAQTPYVFQYGACFKMLGEIYDAKEDNRGAADSFTKAIGVFERLEGDTARHELAYCLNARGCLRFRLGDYRGEVEDVTRAIALKQNDEGSEITMAIMLKNRSDAYRELGNYKSMHSDLSKSIEMLDHSGMPEQLLKPFYGSHWFSMGVCQEGLNRIGKAADAYRKAAGYMQGAEDGSTDDSDVFLHALCHFRRAVCLCKRDEQEFYGALFEYNNAVSLLEHLPSSREKNENLKQVLSSRASLYEVFREIDLAKEDYRRAESLGKSAEA